MCSNELFSCKLVRTYQKSEHELTLEIYNELGRLMAVGHCSYLQDFPQVVLNNVCLIAPIYGYEFRRWLNVCISWCLGDKPLANFESDETLFEEDYLE